jgi:hypothetical protein
MKDGLDLGSFITKTDGYIADTLQKYGSVAIPRAAETVLDSRERIMAWTDLGI